LRADSLIHVKLFRKEILFYTISLKVNNFSERSIFNNSLVDDILTNIKPEHNDIIYQILRKNMSIDSCFLKGYTIHIMNRTINGNGDYYKCYKIIKDVSMSNKYFQSSLIQNRNIHLSAELKEISDLFKLQNITAESLKNTAEKICSSSYTEILKPNKKIDSLCLKLVYLTILSETYTSYINNYVPAGETFTWMKLLDLVLFILFIFSYIYKDELTEWLEGIFLHEIVTTNDKQNYRLLLTILNTLYMKKYLLKNHLEDLTFSSMDIFYNYTNYIPVFAHMAESNKKILKEADDALLHKNMLYSAILLSKFQIFMSFVLSILTYKFVKDLNLSHYWYSILLVTFSFLYMLVVIMESIKMLELIDELKKYSIITDGDNVNLCN
jgi:hypothetical protein